MAYCADVVRSADVEREADSSSSSSDENLASDALEARKQQSIEMRRRAVAELETKMFGGSEWKDLSKRAQKKLIQLRVEKYFRKMRTGESTKEDSACAVKYGCGVSRSRAREENRARVREAMLEGPRVVIDCSMEDLMSPKEIRKLVSQIRGAYSMNMLAEKPLHLHLSGLEENSKVYAECLQTCLGFEQYVLERSPLAYHQLFPIQELVYLSPDAPTVFTGLEPGKVYVVGGLVDTSLHKYLTHTRASKLGVATAKLPIDEFMDGGTHHQGTVLTINQVVCILLEIHAGKTWSEVFSKHVPKRKGFVLKSGPSTDSSGSDEELPGVDATSA